MALAIAELIGIRVHDNARGLWFETYPELVPATVKAGVGNFSIHIGIRNTGSIAYQIGCRLLRLNDDAVLINYAALVQPGEFHNFEITTDMLNEDTNFNVLSYYYDEYGNYTWVRPSFGFTVKCLTVDGNGDDWIPELPLEMWVAIGVAGVVVGVIAVVALTG